MDPISFSESRGSWHFTVNAEPINGSIVFRAEREKDGKKYTAVVIKVFPAEASGMGSFSSFGIGAAIRVVAGAKISHAWKRAIKKITGK